MTSDTCLTGTDRLAEAAQQVDADIYINVQGDEPLVDPKDIKQALSEKQRNMEVIINGFTFIGEDEDPTSVNIPKVITTEDNKLVYMSRSVIPGFKEQKNAPIKYKKQVCIYAFTKAELLSYKNFGRKSELENSEDIEILRFLELGKTIMMFETSPGSLAVDVPDDVTPVEIALKKLNEL
jgi:3-deoxy-manno-octulosonate cytidylyltransferase (CMP-KDO synthetase)